MMVSGGGLRLRDARCRSSGFGLWGSEVQILAAAIMPAPVDSGLWLGLWVPVALVVVGIKALELRSMLWQPGFSVLCNTYGRFAGTVHGGILVQDIAASLVRYMLRMTVALMMRTTVPNLCMCCDAWRKQSVSPPLNAISVTTGACFLLPTKPFVQTPSPKTPSCSALALHWTLPLNGLHHWDLHLLLHRYLHDLVLRKCSRRSNLGPPLGLQRSFPNSGLIPAFEKKEIKS